PGRRWPSVSSKFTAKRLKNLPLEMVMNQPKTDIRRRLGNPIGLFFARALAKTGVTPNALTVIGFLITVAAGVVIGYGHFIWGAIIIAFAGLFDLLDGALARYTGK